MGVLLFFSSVLDIYLPASHLSFFYERCQQQPD